MGHGARVLIERLRMRQSNVKALGQHFLNNEEVLDETMKLANVSSDDHVIEIGPGKGAITGPLLETGANILAFELDQRMIEFLEEKFTSEINKGKFTLYDEALKNLEDSIDLIGNDIIKIKLNILFNLTTEEEGIQNFTLKKKELDELLKKKKH